MTDALALYGTKAPAAPSERFQCATLSFTLEQGALRHIRVGEAEILRGISFLARDRDWGTLSPRLEFLDRQVSPKSTTIMMRATYENLNARLVVDLAIQANGTALNYRATGKVEGDFETNRTGFTVLHPAALAGCPVQIAHSDGTTSKTAFPGNIDPWQPFMDITQMTHQANGLEVTCALKGDTFETEDQRQWGDASFKTYNRPLAKPWPYTLKQGSTLEQSVSVSWRPCTSASPTWTPRKGKKPTNFPETAILVNPKDVDQLVRTPADIRDVGPQRLLCCIDETLGNVADQCQAFGKLQSAFPDLMLDLEAICEFDLPPLAALQRLRKLMDAAGFAPSSILVCPAVDRQSTPPGSEWPPCPPLEDIHDASAKVFGDFQIGGGMVTFFPELNRKRPPLERLGFVSHALCPIVHAADDLSVMETLETVPHITASAKAIIGDKQYRIGPSTIAMRHNPYGQRTIPNPDKGRVCMADDDPRHHADFGAAYAIGLACALASAGIAVWTPSELYGPRGLHGPLKKAITTLARLSREPVHTASVKDGLGHLSVGQSELSVNLTAKARNGLPPFGWTETLRKP